MHLGFISSFKSNKFKYTLAGICFGLCFPILAITLVSIDENRSILEIALTHPVHLLYIIDTAPLFLGLLAYWIGRKQDVIEQSSQALLDEAEKIGKYGRWKLNLTTQEGEWSKGMYYLFDLKQEQQSTPPTFEMFVHLIHPDDRSIVHANFEKILNGSIQAFEIQYRVIFNQSDRFRWYQSMGQSILDHNLKPYKLVGITQDITEKKMMQDELRISRDQALSTAKVKSDFLANMSHEIRTPLNGIIGISTILRQSVTDPVQVEHFKLLESSSQHLLSLVNDILDFSKIEAGKIELESRPFDLSLLIKEVVMNLDPLASSKGIVLSYTIGDQAPKLLGDETRIKQILINLINNALKFTHKGSIKVLARVTNINEHEHKIEISVSDTGIGIPESVRKNLFQSFKQVDASTTRKYGGTGLGLSISKGLVEKMGGTIQVESKLQHGSTFMFDFIAKTHNGEVTDENQRKYFVKFETLNTDRIMKESIKILVAEDNPINQVVIMGFLKKLNQSADLAKNGLEVLELHKHNSYDLILMDCHMPELDGYETTKIIRERFKKDQQPVIIAVTASASREEQEKCYANKMDGFLAKPLTLVGLSEVFKNEKKAA